MSSELVSRLLGTCPICEGSFKLTSTEKLVHHGFKRPGDGVIHGDCFAVDYPPYEVSCEVTKVYRSSIETFLQNVNKTIAQYKANEIKHFVKFNLYSRKTVEFVLGVTDPYVWERECESQIRELEFRARGLSNEIARLTRLIDNWEPRDIQTVMEEKAKNERATREAKAAELEAKRTEKATKEAAKKARKTALEAKRANIKANFVKSFEDLSKEPESHERTLKAYKLVDKFKKINFMWWRDLGCDEALLSLGLAYRENGKVYYR